MSQPSHHIIGLPPPLIVRLKVLSTDYDRFIFLSQNFNYPSFALSLFVKIAVGQIFYYFGSRAILSGDSFEAVVDRIINTVPTSVLNSLRLWPPVTAFTFTFVPMEFRAVFSGLVAIVWQMYLSLLNRKMEIKQKEETGAGKNLAVEGVMMKMPKTVASGL